MSSPPPPTTGQVPVGPDTLITVKVIIDGNNRRFKLALRDLGAGVLPQKLRFLLAIPPEAEVKFDRFSDSAGAYVTLDSTNPSIYKQLYRAAKAKLKLRLRATIIREPSAGHIPGTFVEEQPQDMSSQPTLSNQVRSEPRSTYLQTVLSPSSHMAAQAACANQETQYRTAVASGQATLPPRPTLNGEQLHAQLQAHLRAVNLAHAQAQQHKARSPLPEVQRKSAPSSDVLSSVLSGNFAIDCNNCGGAIANEHYHCSICDAGDFDLCETCVDDGVTCEVQDHWLIKRFQQDGNIIPSVTKTIVPKKNLSQDKTADPSQEAKPEISGPVNYQGDRTCNSCINEFPGDKFVSCDDCPDFDLCLNCFHNGEHGHHPAHSFRPVADDESMIPSTIRTQCKAGRGIIHEAMCDGCDNVITGIRHKCLNCPDWDFCATCVLSAEQIHPGHRFVPIYAPLAASNVRGEIHYGIYCDGPLCALKRRKNYIRGNRYKCAVCHDTDFCANCEAAPTHDHNKTHPLIKFKTPVRHVSVTTLGEDNAGQVVETLGDLPTTRSTPRAKNAATETTPPAPSTNAATQVQTLAEFKPTETGRNEKDGTPTSELQAWFESDSTPDGTKFAPNHFVTQSWTMRNPGPLAWPAGSAVEYVGGDDMRNLDRNHPSSVTDIDRATRSNVLEEGLAPGKTAIFTVVLKSPTREGRFISYWRLKTPEGLAFGHKLWVDLTVETQCVDQRKEELPATKLEVKVEDESKADEGSTMIFPKLEKESPVSSTHDVSAAPAIAVEPTAQTEEQELLEEIENLELEDEETDDGFLTDEEYDILDASDEDYLEAQSQMASMRK